MPRQFSISRLLKPKYQVAIVKRCSDSLYSNKFEYHPILLVIGIIGDDKVWWKAIQIETPFKQEFIEFSMLLKKLN